VLVLVPGCERQPSADIAGIGCHGAISDTSPVKAWYTRSPVAVRRPAKPYSPYPDTEGNNRFPWHNGARRNVRYMRHTGAYLRKCRDASFDASWLPASSKPQLIIVTPDACANAVRSCMCSAYRGWTARVGETPGLSVLWGDAGSCNDGRTIPNTAGNS
jgi:hypothetical protein